MLSRGLHMRSPFLPALVLTLLALLSTSVSTSLAAGRADYRSNRPGTVSAITRDTKNDDDTLDIGRLLFKQMRFRDASQAASDHIKASYPGFRHWLSSHPWRAQLRNTKASRRAYNKVLKRENKMMVDNLAALISNMKGRDTSSQLRMPSLRFG